jgi:translin
MRGYFSELGRLQERVQRLSRRVVRNSARAISAIHRGDERAAERLLERAGQELRQLRELAGRDAWLQGLSSVLSAQQEYAEARLLQGLLRGRLLRPKALGVDYRAYLGAVADVIGELRRCALDAVRRGELRRAEQMLERMEELYDLLMEFDYADSVVPGLRRKQDVARQLIERTRGDLTLLLGRSGKAI